MHAPNARFESGHRGIFNETRAVKWIDQWNFRRNTVGRPFTPGTQDREITKVKLGRKGTPIACSAIRRVTRSIISDRGKKQNGMRVLFV